MRLRALLAAPLLLAPLTPAISATPPKTGAICSKAGITRNYDGKKYTCIKSGKKLVWNKGVTIKSPAPTPAQTTPPMPTPSPTPTAIPSPTTSPSPSSSPSSSPSPSPSSSPSSSPSPSPSSSPSPSPSPSPSQSPNQNELDGKLCATEKEISRNVAGEYWCLKDNNGVLRWSKNMNPSTSSGTIFKQKVSDVSYTVPTQPSQSVELCKIQQVNYQQGELKSGFPSPIPSYQSIGVVKWALVPLDFSDLPGEPNFMDRVKKEMQSASDWADNTSEGKFKIEWQVYDKWVRLPGTSKDYLIPPESNGGFIAPDQQRFWQRAITEADKYVDFTGVQAVQFILPAGQEIVKYGIKGNNWYDVVKNYTTSEGTKIDLFSIPSTFNDEPNSGRNYWSWWMYHYMVGLGVAKFGSSSIASELHTYLIQAGTEGARESGGWIRFLVGWMPESRVYCRQANDVSTLEMTLIPLTENKQQGIKLAVFPISKTKALILESRRVTQFSCTTPTERNGVLAYVYDATLGHMSEYFTAIAPPGRPNESASCFASQSRDLLLHEGDKVTFEGITIEMLAHGDFDRVRISRNS